MRYVIAIVGLLLVIGGLVFVKFSQISMLIGMGEAMAEAGPPPEAVAAAKATEQDWEVVVASVGTISSVKGVSISTEVPGVVSKLAFDSGAEVKKGDVLVELDSSVERAQLVAAQVRRDLAQTNVKRTRLLVGSGVSTQAQLDAEESQLKSADAELNLLSAQIAKKTVRAPFPGKVGIRSVNLGQYVSPGTPLAVIESVDGAYVDFSLPQQQEVSLGMRVRVSIEGATKLDTEGTVTAIDPNVDPVTRSIKLRANIADKDGKLSPGMFAKVRVVLPKSTKVVTVPLTAVVYASYGDSVFVVEEPGDTPGSAGPNGEPRKVARQQFVRLGERRGDFVAVLDGVKAGEEVVVAGAFKLRNKAGIFLNNDLAPKPEVAPKPENR